MLLLSLTLVHVLVLTSSTRFRVHLFFFLVLFIYLFIYVAGICYPGSLVSMHFPSNGLQQTCNAINGPRYHTHRQHNLSGLHAMEACQRRLLSEGLP